MSVRWQWARLRAWTYEGLGRFAWRWRLLPETDDGNRLLRHGMALHYRVHNTLDYRSERYRREFFDRIKSHHPTRDPVAFYVYVQCTADCEHSRYSGSTPPAGWTLYGRYLDRESTGRAVAARRYDGDRVYVWELC